MFDDDVEPATRSRPVEPLGIQSVDGHGDRGQAGVQKAAAPGERRHSAVGDDPDLAGSVAPADRAHDRRQLWVEHRLTEAGQIDAHDAAELDLAQHLFDSHERRVRLSVSRRLVQ